MLVQQVFADSSGEGDYFNRRVVVAGGLDYVDRPVAAVNVMDYDIFSDVKDILDKEWSHGPWLPIDNYSLPLSPSMLPGMDRKVLYDERFRWKPYSWTMGLVQRCLWMC